MIIPIALLFWATTTSPIIVGNASTSPVEPPSVERCVSVPKELIYHKIADIAQEYGVSEARMVYIVYNEAAKTRDGDFLPCGNGDTHLTDPNGEPHLSRGIVQINKYWQPDVTEAQAHDIDFSLKFLAENLSKGRCSWWTTCRAYNKLLAEK